jgi:hypothetical protein
MKTNLLIFLCLSVVGCSSQTIKPTEQVSVLEQMPGQSLTLQSEVFRMSRQETIDAIKECESSGLRAIPIWGKRKINGVPSSIMVDVTCGPLWGSRR